MREPLLVRPGASAAQSQRESTVLSSYWFTWLFGRPLSPADAPHEAVGKGVGLAVFSSDALSSTAYASQEILHIRAFAGTAAFAPVFLISIGIVLLLLALMFEPGTVITSVPYQVGREGE